jgi:hypothetical protein
VGASIYDHLATVQYLVNQGVYVTSQDNEAVGLASQWGYLTTVQYHVTQGVDVARIEPRMLEKYVYHPHSAVLQETAHPQKTLEGSERGCTPCTTHPQVKGGYFARKALLECL